MYKTGGFSEQKACRVEKLNPRVISSLSLISEQYGYRVADKALLRSILGAHVRPSLIMVFSILMLHRDDDISLSMPFFDISVSLNNLRQGVAPIDDGLQPFRLNQSGEENKVFDLLTGTS